MANLEDEYLKLVRGMRDQVTQKENDGEITYREAEQLRSMIDDRVKLSDADPDTYWNGSQSCS